MVSIRWQRYAPLTGVVFVVLMIISFIVQGKRLSAHASGAEVIAHYKAHHASAMASSWLSALAIIFFVFFAAALSSHLRQFQAARTPVELALAGAAVLAVGVASFAAFRWSLADARNTLVPAAAQALNVLNEDFVWPFLIGIAIFGIAAGLAIVRSRVLPVWLGWIAIVLGILGVTPASFVAFLVLMAWTLLVSVLLFRSQAAPAAAAS